MKINLFSLLLMMPVLTGFSLSAQVQFDILLRNGRILDGSGNPWYRADIGIKGERIMEIGDLGRAKATTLLDATGLYVAPGFIDVHSHAANGLIAEDRSHAHPLLAQGITTVIINPDGGGPVDLSQQAKELLRHGLGINVILLIGHGSVRQAVMGLDDRLATEEEIKQMKALVRKGMATGAFGLSSGPFYAPGSYSDTRELVELSKIVAGYGGVYTSHIRDESNYTIGVVAAVDEVIQIAREARLPAVVTHIKVLGPPVWGYARAVIQRIERAREEGLEVYADQYPYLASATGLSAALLPRWAQEGGREALLQRLSDPATKEKIREAMKENLTRRGGPERIQFRYFQADRSVEGKSLKEMAQKWELEPVEAALKMLQLSSPGIVSFNMQASDVKDFMQQNWVMSSSDGSFPVWGQGVPHPRSFGTFPKKIRKYVLEDEVIDLPFAIRSMTSLPAQVFKINDRGYLKPGAIADLVVFDLQRLQDRATFTTPFQMAEGMVHVVVNGQFAILNEKLSSRRNGQVLWRVK